MKRHLLIGTFVTSLALASTAWAQSANVGFGGGGHDRSAAVEVAADSLQVNQETGQATLIGNVVVVQGPLRLSAQEVYVDYSEASGKRSISRLRARGDVIIVSGPDVAEGQEAIYTLGSGEVVMTGNVMLLQGNNALTGERLVVDLNTGKGQVSGRVRTTLQVSE